MTIRTERDGWIFGAGGRVVGCTLALAAVLLVTVTAARSQQTQVYSVLHKFTGPDGSIPESNAVLDKAGNIYGTTAFGGNLGECHSENGPPGCGVVFKIDPTGKETTLHNFNESSADGQGPAGGLVLDSLGNIYGVAGSGGTYGYGIAFKLHPSGNETVLYNFGGPAGDAANPAGSLVRDSAGNLYGVASGGGAEGFGAVFELNASGKDINLYSFAGSPTDGTGYPGSLVRDSAGNLYGVSQIGGPDYAGLVFKLNASFQETVLYNFTGKADGGSPNGGLLRDAKGNLYGTTEIGGNDACGGLGCGVAFRLSPSGGETVAHFFTGLDGIEPFAGLMGNAPGGFYGTTFAGGSGGGIDGYGVVFSLSLTGKETVIYNFTGGSDGALPAAGLARDAAGNLYGTTSEGGAGGCGSGCGLVFKLTPAADAK